MFSAWFASRVRRVPLVVEVRDLWPASLVVLGARTSKPIIYFLSWLERFLYDRSALIVTLTEGMRRNIVSRGWCSDKVHTVRYGVSPDRFFPDPAAAKKIRVEEGWEKLKIVLYLGSLGLANNVDVIVRAAAQLRRRPDILFVLIGDGLEKARLAATAKGMALNNVVFHAPIAARHAQAYINAADLCVVTLRDDPLFESAIPSKLIEYMACGKAVVVGVRGEAQAIVKDAGAGLPFNPDDDDQLASFIEALIDDPERREMMGRQGPLYTREHFLLEKNQAALYGLLVEVTQRKNRSR
jgi:glycosyltransferase involved in cell wall biosynthesis